MMVVGYEEEELLKAPLEPGTVLDVVPCFAGGKSPLIQIALGAALIGVAFTPIGTVAAGIFLSLGVGLALGGVLQLIAPVPTREDSAIGNVESSKYLGAPKNTVAIGTPIPILYGRHQVYGHYLSCNISAVDVRTND